jgi:hypothetical protein
MNDGRGEASGRKPQAANEHIFRMLRPQADSNDNSAKPRAVLISSQVCG